MNKKYYLISLLAALFLYAPLCAQLNKNTITDLDKYIKQSQKKWNIPGLAIAIVQNDKIIFEKGYGQRSVDSKQQVDENTLFAVASNTKAFTSAALSILVDEGKISWDDPVQKYLPYFKLYSPYVSEAMTIRDLLCHRTGLKTFSGDLLWYGTTHSREEVIRRARFLEPTYGFREQYGYSNIMFLAAGEIIPVVTGKSWDEYIKEKFFVPLQMNTSNTSITDFTKSSNMASPHHVAIGEKTQVIPYVNWDNIGPAGSINSSVHEMAQWIRMQLNNGIYQGTKVLSEKQIHEMRQPNTPKKISPQRKQIWPSTHFSAYALGWDLFDYHGVQIVNHGGGADGMISKVVLVPEKNLGFVILTNSINYLSTALMYDILDRYFGAEHKDWSEFYYTFYKNSQMQTKADLVKKYQNQNKDAKPSLPLSDYAGKYHCKMYGDLDITVEDGKLVAKFIPTPAFVGDLTHYQYNTFAIKLKNLPALTEGAVNFILNQKGKVEQARVDIPNPDFDFTELKFFKVN